MRIKEILVFQELIRKVGLRNMRLSNIKTNLLSVLKVVSLWRQENDQDINIVIRADLGSSKEERIMPPTERMSRICVVCDFQGSNPIGGMARRVGRGIRSPVIFANTEATTWLGC